MFLRRVFLAVLAAGLVFNKPDEPAMAAGCDWAQFISDVTVPDGAPFPGGSAFTKTWRLKNVGSCTWTTAYRLIFSGGDPMGAASSAPLAIQVLPGQTADISVGMVAPLAAGHYRGYWKLNNSAGAAFGIGSSAAAAFWVDIVVTDSHSTAYDFVANASQAQWRSGVGTLPFPGAKGDVRGYALRLDHPNLEDASSDVSAGLLTAPQNTYNGYIQALYPEYSIQPGDRFQSLVNCEFGAGGCYVTFQLGYVAASGSMVTLWTWREKNEGLYYRADIGLSQLAGQRVRFVLTVFSSGSANDDRAVWGSPRIVHTEGGTPSSPPTALTTVPASPLPAGCDRAAFLADVTVADGTLLAPGAAFTKVWRLLNSGSCTWTSSYKLVFYGGEPMAAPASIHFPQPVAPGQMIDLQVDMIAPATAGEFRGFWILQNSSGRFFGIGGNASQPFWVEIHVGSSSFATAYDFAANICSAQWRSAAGILPCPGLEGDRNGFVVKPDSIRLEDGSISSNALLAAPQDLFNGYLQGLYPAMVVQPGDRFRATVGCAYAAACYVTYRLDYLTAGGSMGTVWTWRERNEGLTYSPDISLAPLAGQNVRFVLTLLATGSAAGDRAVWSAPSIVRMGLPIPPTPTRTPTIIPASATITQAPASTVTPGPSASAIPPPTFTVTPSLTATPTFTSTPTSTATRSAELGPYAVTLVGFNDVLNIRSGPGADLPIVGSFPREATGVMRTGPAQTVDGAEWVEVLRPEGGAGWVNSRYLTEFLSSEVFCADPRPRSMIELFRQSIKFSDGQTFASLISPKHGLNLSYWSHGTVVNYTSATAPAIFTSSELINWGSGPRGENDIGTFAGIVQPELAAVLNSGYELHCDDPSYARMFVNPWPYANIHYYAVVKPPTPGIDLDWKEWLLGFEYVNGQPGLFGAIHFIWEP